MALTTSVWVKPGSSGTASTPASSKRPVPRPVESLAAATSAETRNWAEAPVATEVSTSSPEPLTLAVIRGLMSASALMALTTSVWVKPGSAGVASVPVPSSGVVPMPVWLFLAPWSEKTRKVAEAPVVTEVSSSCPEPSTLAVTRGLMSASALMALTTWVWVRPTAKLI